MDELFRPVTLAITFEEFRRLPRNAVFRYEYKDGRAVLSPRPKTFTCVLDLPASLPPPTWVPISLRPLAADEMPGLADLFLRSFRPTEPFASMEDPAELARWYLEQTVQGEFGPLVGAACVRAGDLSDRPVGAAAVTLVRAGILKDPSTWAWPSLPSADAVARRDGVPHLSWLFVDPREHRRGVGTTILAAVARSLHAAGFAHLTSTFQLDNGPSCLWHWRNGFRLLTQGSAER